MISNCLPHGRGSYSVNTMSENQNENVGGLCECWQYYRTEWRTAVLHAVIYTGYGTANMCDLFHFRLVRIAIVPSAHTILFNISILHLIPYLAPGSLSLAFVHAFLSTTPGLCAVDCCAAVNGHCHQGSSIRKLVDLLEPCWCVTT